MLISGYNIASLHGCKNDSFQMENSHIFLFCAQDIDCWYSLEPGSFNNFSYSVF